MSLDVESFPCFVPIGNRVAPRKSWYKLACHNFRFTIFIFDIGFWTRNENVFRHSNWRASHKSWYKLATIATTLSCKIGKGTLRKGKIANWNGKGRKSEQTAKSWRLRITMKRYFWAIFTLVAFRNGRPTHPATNEPPAERNVAFVAAFFGHFLLTFTFWHFYTIYYR